MPLSAPPSMQEEHDEIWRLLVEVQSLSGKTGALAEKLAKDLKTHIDKEESLALPLLGILPDLVNGRLGNPTAKRAAMLHAMFEKEYPGMIHGHDVIRKSLAHLRKIGAEEGHLTAVRFADALEKHSQEEEEVLYPAALLAGELASMKPRR